ncbi:putative dehydrogenase [Motilibacter peucedani]|uniref:Putative dehydrogenase n=1 Tax=Motilibacter peucedani TaxID=598650 RepID=A0A420XTF4_9ACTN|nr:putative dehydrogenase [Motilibacter peucedani]
MGVIGVGALGSMHLRNLASLPACRVTHVADTHLSEGGAATAHLHGATLTDVASMLAPGTVDAVVVSTPTDTHAQLVVAALRAGVSVFCEKPMARTAQEARTLVDLARSRGAKVAVGHVVRYFPEYAAAYDLVRGKQLGTVRSARMARLNASPGRVQQWYRQSGRSGGVLLDMAIHDIDWALWTFGPAARVFATRAGEPGAEVVSVTLKHLDGQITYLDASWRDDAFSTSLELWGSEGFYRVAGSSSAGFEVSCPRTDQSGDYLPGPDSSPVPDDPYRLELAAAVDWFAGTGPAPLATAEEGLAALRVVEAAEASIQSRQPVMVEEEAA